MPNFNGLWTSRQQMQARGGNTWPALPGAPTSPVATAGSSSASVAFTAPANIGYPGSIIGYRVTSSPGGFTGTGLTSPVTVTGLTNGTAYTFTVAAQNVNGYGPESVASNSVTPIPPNYIEEVFSTWLYTGNGGANTINNGINLAGKGGLVWTKPRTSGTYNYHVLVDTVRGANNRLFLPSTIGQDFGTSVANFSSTGFSVSFSPDSNESGANYASWTFREQNKFFDIATYTGDGSFIRLLPWPANVTDSTIGAIIIKRTDSDGEWIYWHRTFGWQYLRLNATAAVVSATVVNGGTGSDGYYVNDIANISGASYVAYFFAHNAGGFGLSGNENVITCGSYTGNGSATGPVIDLGYEPQWVMIKRSSGAANWEMYDTMRGFTNGGLDNALFPNLDSAENTSNAGVLRPLATGFQLTSTSVTRNASGSGYIYIAIRRGLMAVPTLGTNVFTPALGRSQNPNYVSNFPVDFAMSEFRTSGANSTGSRLQGSGIMDTASTAVESSDGSTVWDFMDGYYINGRTSSFVSWMFRRAPGYMDVVCTQSGQFAVPHNLAVPPELIISKQRVSGGSPEWFVTVPSLGYAYLSTTSAFFGAPVFGAFTATNFTTPVIGAYNAVNYLFATCPGVSKVGTYTGTGATQIIACGFAAGARFVLIKSTSTTGDWYVWDSARGIVAGNDPYLRLNTTSAEVTGTDWVDTATTGFELSNAGGNLANSNGVSYIYLAIA